MSRSNQVNQLTDVINFSDTSTAYLPNSLSVTLCQGHLTSSHADVLNMLVSTRGFKEVELRILLTVFMCSVVFPQPQAKPEISSCLLSWSCSPARDSNCADPALSAGYSAQLCSEFHHLEHCCVSTLLISNLFFALSKKGSRCCKAVCPRFNHWGLLICRLNQSFAWAFTNIFSFPFFSSPPIFLTAVRINQPPVAVASPKVQEVSLPTTSTFIDGSRMYCAYILYL